MSSLTVIVWGSTLASAGLAVATLIYRPRSIAQRLFLGGMLLMVVEGAMQILSLQAASLGGMLFWQRLSLVPFSLMPLVWLAFSLTFARGEARQFFRRWRVVLFATFTGLAIVLGVAWPDLMAGPIWTDSPGRWVFPTGTAGRLLFGYVVVASVLVLANLEGTFRSAVGTARWKIKYTVMGLALWSGAHIYTGSQVLLYSGRGQHLVVLEAAAGLLACIFFAVAVFRSRLAGVEIYPSPAALHKSVSVILAGAYLAAVGLAAKAASAMGWWQNFPLASVIILLGLSGFGVLCLSDRLRASLRQFIIRHFKRPSHDYRLVWSNFTAKTAARLDAREYGRQLVAVLAETFEALSVSLWLADFTKRHFALLASSSLEGAGTVAATLDEAVFAELTARDPAVVGPVDLNRCPERWCAMLKAANPARFPQVAGEYYCLPLAFGGEWVGLVVVGDRVGGRPFTAEDLDLLRCLGDQMAAGLRTVNLSEKVAQARELEAFQMMSAFLVHDLKNTASALSLTLKNLPRHFDNPAFRDDALRVLTRSVQRVNDLIERLGTLRREIRLNRTRADLNRLVASARQAAGPMPRCAVSEQLGTLPPLLVDAAHIEAVIINLLLNARDAVGDKGGEIHIETDCVQGYACLTVRDNGVGMSADFQANSLFKPFKTSKKNGLGIGMYQARTIIEAHGGRITVQSQPGAGACFRVYLPLDPNAASSPPAA